MLYSVSLDATKVLIEKERKASCTLKVATAESFLPVKGYTSGPLWAALFKFTLQTKFTKVSINGANILGAEDPRGNPDGLYTIISLTETELILYVDNNAGGTGWTWVFKPEWYN